MFVSMFIQEKILSISICDFTMRKIQQVKINSRKHGFMFFPSLKKTFHFLGIRLVAFKNQ
jgi:hypothetical protein